MEIKLAFRKLAHEWHPDKNNSKLAHHKFIEIREAYGVLSDRKARASYDLATRPESPPSFGTAQERPRYRDHHPNTTRKPESQYTNSQKSEHEKKAEEERIKADKEWERFKRGATSFAVYFYHTFMIMLLIVLFAGPSSPNGVGGILANVAGHVVLVLATSAMAIFWFVGETKIWMYKFGIPLVGTIIIFAIYKGAYPMFDDNDTYAVTNVIWMVVLYWFFFKKAIHREV